MTTQTAAVGLPSIKFQSLATAAQANVPVTFGQVFAPGDLMAGRGLIARAADGSYLPLQVDQKATHPEGSVRHAIISGILPALAAGETLSFQLLDADKRSSVQTFAGAPASVAIVLAGVAYTAAIDPAAAFALWLTGPVVNEHQFNVPFTAADGTKHPHLMARFAVRDYGSAQRVDVAIENNWAYVSGPQNFAYDCTITVAGHVVYSKAALTHLPQGRWRKVFWTGIAPQINIQQPGQLIATKTVSNYDPAFPPSESTLNSLVQRSSNEPMQLAAASGYMPTTGGNDEIGLQPMWTASWILSQDVRARDCMLATADCAGSYGVHYRDQDTDRPISLSRYPYMTAVGSSSDTWNPATGLREGFPGPGNDRLAAGLLATQALNPDGTLNGDDVPWHSPFTVDEAHQPDLAFVAYVATGDYYYLEEMQFWAMYNTFRENPNYRGKGQGLIIAGELRAQAWALRTIAEAAVFTPDADPLKPDLMGFAKNNIDWYNSQYVGGPLDNKLGVPTHGGSLAYNNGTAVAPWMHDFFTSVFGHLIDLGFVEAKPFFAWLAKFTVGRMMAPGICWYLAVIYALQVRETSTSPVYETFTQAFTSLYGADVMAMGCNSPEMAASQNRAVGDMGGVSNGVMGYPSNYQPALAYAVDAGIANAEAAWALFMSRTVKPDYSDGPQFSIVPVGYVNPSEPPPPPLPTGPQDWQQIAVEGQTVAVPADTTVRFGADTRWVSKVCSGAVQASSAVFGADPAPGTAKVLQQLIPSTEGNPMTYKLSIGSGTYADQALAFGTEAPTGVLIEVLAPDGVTVLGSVAAIPGDIAGLVVADLTAVHFLRGHSVNSSGAMGTPVLQSFVPQTFLPAAPPVPTTQPFPILSGLTFTLAAE